MQQKNIQISEDLFKDIWILLTFPELPDWDYLHDSVLERINDKIEKIIDRNLYTTYKTAPTAEQREKARQAYLDRKGIPKDFRW